MNREGIFAELRAEFAKEVILESFLNAIAIFLALNLFFNLFVNFTDKILLAMIISSLYLVVAVAIKAKKFYVRLFERRVPDLREALRTAYEYKGSGNEVVENLFQDIWTKLRRTSSGKIISVKSVVSKMSVIAVLSFIIISLNFVHVELPQISFSGSKGQGTLIDGNFELLQDDSVFGERKIINIGNESIELQIEAFKNLLGKKEKESETKINDYKVPRFNFEDQELFEEKQIEDFEIVKKYNEELRKRL